MLLQAVGVHTFSVVEDSDGCTLIVKVGWEEHCDSQSAGVERIGDELF
jgi:hypothetical protein